MVAPANYMPGWSYIFYSPHPLTVVGQVFSGASVPSSSSIDCFLSLHLLSPPLIAFSFLSGPTHQSNIYHKYASILACCKVSQKLQNCPYHQCFFLIELPKKNLYISNPSENPEKLSKRWAQEPNSTWLSIQTNHFFTNPIRCWGNIYINPVFLEYFFAEKGSERFQQPDLYCVYSADRSSVTVVLDKLKLSRVIFISCMTARNQCICNKMTIKFGYILVTQSSLVL